MTITSIIPVTTKEIEEHYVIKKTETVDYSVSYDTDNHSVIIAVPRLREDCFEVLVEEETVEMNDNREKLFDIIRLFCYNNQWHMIS